MTAHYTPKAKTVFDDWWMITECLKQRCAPEQGSIIHWYDRLWYTFKAAVCILVGNTKGGYSCPEDLSLIGVAAWGYQSDTGGMFNEAPSYAASWQQVSVTRGSWHVHIFYNQNY